MQGMDDIGVLHWAAIKGHGPLAKMAISKGADLNEPCCRSLPESDRFERGCTPLHLAIMYDSPDVIRALIEAGAQLFATGENARGPLGMGGYPSAFPGETPLHLAAKYSATRSVSVLRDLCPASDMTQFNERLGRMPGHPAARFGTVSTMEAFLQAGFNISALDRYGGTVLHAALGFKPRNCEVMEYLLGQEGSSSSIFKIVLGIPSYTRP